jgi:hypothetical protein
MKKYTLKKSRGRKYTRRRNIRKYKKNQKGGKTPKRLSLEKRRGKTKTRKTRRMRGGYEYRFRVNTDKLKKYIESEYYTKLSKLELVAYGVIGITNRSKGFFLRADHRQEQISVFACYTSDTPSDTQQPAFYAIARCVNSCPENLDKSYFQRKPTETPNFEMESKILFLKPENLRKIDLQNTTDTKTQKALELLKQKLRDKNYREDIINELTSNIPCYEFENSFSSTDNYRIVIFPGRVVKTNQNLENLFSSIQQSIQQSSENETPFTPEVVSYPDVTQQKQIQSTRGDSSLSAVEVVGLANIFFAALSALSG